MQFLYPSFLWALALLAVPIIIHLFYFRRFRKVYFSNVKFLKEVKEETSMRSRLRNLLVLLARCLALAGLVFAFAQPFLPAENQNVLRGRKSVSVYVDNSFSMGAENDRAPLLEVAKDRAREVINAYGVEDRFQLLTNEFAGRQQRLLGKEEVLTLIDEIKVSPASRSLSQALDRQINTMNQGSAPNRVAYQISDFQRSVTDLNAPEDTSLQLNLLPLQAVRERNVSIDSAWFEAPIPQLNQNNLLLVRVRNHSDEDLDNIRLSLRYDGQTKPEGILSIPANSYVLDSVFINISKAGVGKAELQITDYPIQFDDRYFLTFNILEKVKVLNINNGNQDRNLAAALRGLSIFEADFSSDRQLDYGSLGEQQLIILSQLPEVSSGLAARLTEYVRNGGNLLVFPPRAANLNSYRNFLNNFPADELGTFDQNAREVDYINTSEFVFKDVFDNRRAALRLPTTQGNFPLSRFGSRRQEALLRYRDGSTALAKYNIDQGNLYLSAAPLDNELSNLSLNAEVFIPMLYKMAISTGKRRPVAYTIGNDEVIETPRRQATAELVYRLSGPEGEFIPGQRIIGNRIFLSLDNQVPAAGFYDLLLQDDEASDAFAFNYSRDESQLDYYSPDELQELVGQRVNLIEADNEAAFAAQIETGSQGTPLWRYGIWAALLFLLVEVLLLRFWKT
ncbi:hypothetical protein CEQ90_14465 [Lewinellaceae bacterium SD302]|nr:hypothetical protein CEQ90_14465 [Lewinellaceae bacterium SD302]